MNKTKIGIFLSLLLLIGLTSCGEQKSNNKLLLNEVLIDNQNNSIFDILSCPSK